MRIPFFRLLAGLTCLALPATSRTSLNYFNSGMVLQREMAVPVWGKAGPGEDVTVRFNGQAKTAKAGSDSVWILRLDAMPAGGPFAMTVRGRSDSLAFSNVMVGEVWLCGGQSNMDFSLTEIGGTNVDTAKAADIPTLRLMDVRGGADWHDNNPGGRWAACTPASAAKFSATGFYFGREIHKALGGKVAVGLIEAAVGATSIDRWMDPVSIRQDPVLAANAAAHGALYRKWIVPVMPYGIRGMIWFQGESDANDTLYMRYRSRFGSLIRGWRGAWGQGDFPCYFVQLGNYQAAQAAPGEESLPAFIREAQRLSLETPATAMAVAIDIGDVNVHGRNKAEVGRRLSLPARALLYGEKGLAYSSPLFETARFEGDKVRLRFASTGGGLAARGGGAPKGFAVSGADGRWSWADAVVDGDTVTVASASVPKPAKVRYAWANNPVANLYGASGLPVAPFRTDGPAIPVPVREAWPDPAPPKASAASGRGIRDGLGRRIPPAGPARARRTFRTPRP